MKMIGKLQLTASMNGMVWYFRGTSKVQLQEIQDIPKKFYSFMCPSNSTKQILL